MRKSLPSDLQPARSGSFRERQPEGCIAGVVRITGAIGRVASTAWALGAVHAVDISPMDDSPTFIAPSPLIDVSPGVHRIVQGAVNPSGPEQDKHIGLAPGPLAVDGDPLT